METERADSRLIAYLAVAKDLIGTIEDCKESQVFNAPLIKCRIEQILANLEGLEDLLLSLFNGSEEIGQD